MVPTKENRRQLQHQWNRRLSTFCPRTICTTDETHPPPTKQTELRGKKMAKEFQWIGASRITIIKTNEKKKEEENRNKVISSINISLLRLKVHTSRGLVGFWIRPHGALKQVVYFPPISSSFAGVSSSFSSRAKILLAFVYWQLCTGMISVFAIVDGDWGYSTAVHHGRLQSDFCSNVTE